MQGAELSAAAVKVLTGSTAVSVERSAELRGIVWGQLGRSALGSSALARLQDDPGEWTAEILGSVIAEEVRANPDFGERLRSALLSLGPLAAHTPAGTPPHGTSAVAGPPPPVPPPRPVAPPRPRPVAPEGAEVRKVWLLGLPQALLAYVLLAVLSRLLDLESGWALAVQSVVLLVSTGLAAYGVWCAALLLRRGQTAPLVAATILDVLVLVRLFLWLIGV